MVLVDSAELEVACDFLSNRELDKSYDLGSRFLVKTEDVARRIAKTGGDFRCVRADGLHDLAAVGQDRVDRSSHAVAHDVDQQTGCRRCGPPGHPGTADLAYTIVECGFPITATPDLPTKYSLIELD